MSRLFAKTSAFLIVVLYSSFASAGVYTDDMAKCLVKSSSTTDQSVLVQWLFSMFALNPAVKPLSSITPAQRDVLSHQVSVLMLRLVGTDCRKETVDALKYEGPNAFEGSFEVLGQVAARGLMSDPNVAAGMQKLSDYTDKEKMGELYKQAGLPPPVYPASNPVTK